MRVLSKDWHKWCFKCHICETTLQLGNYQDHDGEPYCKKCYGQAYGAQGYKSGMYNAYEDGKISDLVAQKKERKQSMLKENKEKEEAERKAKEEAEAKRIEEEQAASRRAAEEAERQRKEAEERARVEAEAVAKKKAEEEEQASVKQREEAEKMAEEEAKKRAEEEALAQTEAATVEAASIAIRPSVVEGQSNKADRASLEERAQKEGYITKAPTSGKQGLFKRDRRRYFKLDKTQLSFYQDASMFDLLKQFTVEGEAVEEAGGEHELKVPVSSTAFGSRLSLLKFESAAELAEWKEALSAAAQLAAI